MLWAFESTVNPKAEWVCLVQGDVLFLPGWLEEFEAAAARGIRFLACGPGDQAVFIHIDAFREIGWWDERFAGIGFHEFDYFLRAYIRLGPVASIEGHGDQFIWNWASQKFLTTQGGDRSGHSARLNPQLWGHLVRKWGQELIHNTCGNKETFSRWTEFLDVAFGTLEERSESQKRAIPKDYNWYPYIYKKDQRSYAHIYYDFVPLGEMEHWVEQFERRTL